MTQKVEPAPQIEAPAQAPSVPSQEAKATETQQAPPQTQPDAKTGEAAPPVALKAPEGKEFDSEALSAFSESAKEAGLSGEAAQKMLDKLAPVLEARQLQQIEATRTSWATAAKADKEIGGDKLPESLSTAKRALDQFGTPALRELLDSTGLGNHPEVIRAFARAGKAISEDKVVGGAAKKAAPTDPAKVMFPNMN